MEPLPPDHRHDPKVLRSWAKRTGYHASGELVKPPDDLETLSSIGEESSPLSMDPRQKTLRDRRLPKISEYEPQPSASPFPPPPPPPPPPPSSVRRSTVNIVLPPPPPPSSLLGPASVVPTLTPTPAPLPQENVDEDRKVQFGPYHPLGPQHHAKGGGDMELCNDYEMGTPSLNVQLALPSESTSMKIDIARNPSLLVSTLYGLQHYLSMIGSIILIPLMIVPAMGGSDEDTAGVISTVLMVTGVTTLMNNFFGSRLPLVQGPSFVYLAPALSIINATEFQRIGTDRFRHTMRELQGAVIAASLFQMLLGYSGLMSVLLRLVNPVVVTPTIAAVGLAFFTYGFPVVGSCVEIGLPQILVVLIFSLYLRRKLVFGYRIFQVYAMPMGLAIVWIYALILTAAGAYNYKGCSINVPASNIISETCRKHAFTMMHCRTDVTTAWKTTDWLRFPYPFQWGVPTFQLKTISVMVVASVIASIDSIGSYHASSMLVGTKPPTPGIVSRAIGMEGLNSILAGFWGIGTGATTLTENVHTISVTKIGNRKAIGCGACVLIVASVFGKVGAILASIPQVIVAALLSVMWIMVTALGLSNLRYSTTGSSRNVIIVGSSIFLSLSIPAYFQQYATNVIPATTLSYFVPYTVAAHGPIRTGFEGLDFFLNATFSMNMAIAFIVAFFLDNTVEGKQQERDTYMWSEPSIFERDTATREAYSLPPGIAKMFRWAKCVGL